MGITGDQSFIARRLCSLKSTVEVAEHIGIARSSYNHWEAGSKKLAPATIEKAQIFFENRGIRFEKGSAYKLDEVVRTYIGQDGFRQFMDEVYYAAVSGYTDFRIQNARPANWTKYLGEEWYDMHAQRMREYADKISFKITCKEGDYNHIASNFAEYRWVKQEHFNDQSIYIYGDQVAFMSFENDDVTIININSTQIANTIKQTFDFFWQFNTFIPEGHA